MKKKKKQKNILIKDLKKKNINIKKNDKVNARLKMLQEQNNKLLLNMNTDVEKRIKQKEEKLNLEEKQKNENYLKFLEKMRSEEKSEILKRKNKINEEKEKVEEYINKKLEVKEYLYQKKNSEFNRKMKKIISEENQKRKNNMQSMELSNMNDFIKNYEIIKVKKHLELEKKSKFLKKSWSERGMMISKYKNELSNLIDEEEKNRKLERQMILDKKMSMKNKQIDYSKKFENNLIMDYKQNNIYKDDTMKKIKNKYNKKDEYKPNLKLKSLNNYCNSIRKKLLTKKSTESKNILNIKPNHIDLTKNKNSFNIIKTPNLKLPNLSINNQNQISNKDIKFTKLEKNPKVYKLKKNDEIQNLIDKNGINAITLEMVNSKLENLKEKKEQKDLLLKYQGGIASNPDLGEEVCDMLIDSMNAKMSLMDEMKRLVKKGNKKNLVDRGTGINDYRNDNENEENEEEEDEN